MIITIIVVVLAGAVSRWVRAGEREIRSSEERRTPGGCLSSVASLLAGGDGSTRLGRRGGSGGCVAVLDWVYGPRRTVLQDFAEQFARQVSGLLSPGCPSQGSWLLWHCLAPWSPCRLSEGAAWGRRFGGSARPAV